jgi:hypothetical protein
MRAVAVGSTHTVTSDAGVQSVGNQSMHAFLQVALEEWEEEKRRGHNQQRQRKRACEQSGAKHSSQLAAGHNTQSFSLVLSH